MMDSITKMEGVGPATCEVFKEVGINTVMQLREFDSQQDALLLSAIRIIRRRYDFDDAHWQAMMSRCLNIIYRAKSTQASGYVPNEYMCPITLDWFRDAVVAPCGHSFSRKAIEEHLLVKQTNPITGEELHSHKLYPNSAMVLQVLLRNS